MHWMIGRLRAEPKRRLTLMRAADAFEDFFASLNWSGSMYGWRFLDDPSLRRDWPVRPSLTIDIRPGRRGSHAVLVQRVRAGGRRHYGAYCLEGTVGFEGPEVLRSDATPQPAG